MPDEDTPQVPSGLPLINQMGVDAAARNSLLNRATRYQLEYVREELKGYLSGVQMPHEWGSMDSLDDMRNSMYTATRIMDDLLWVKPGKEQEALRDIIADRGVCATDERVIELAWPGQVDDGTWMDELDKYEGD